jgi:hypothetical protein
MNAPDNALGLFAKQEKTRATAAVAKNKVASLERDRHVALLGDGDIKTVLAIDDQIARHRRLVNLCHDRLAALARPLSGPEADALGLGAKYHPITRMVLEQGSGALDPDAQARVLHVPIIARTEGEAAAAAMLAKLDAAAKAA